MEEFDKLFNSIKELKLKSNSKLFKILKTFENLIESSFNNLNSNSNDSKNEENNDASLIKLTSLISTELIELLQLSPIHILPNLNTLIIHITKELNIKGKDSSSVPLEALIESILRLLKTFLTEERKETPKDKILLGTVCFKSLAKLLDPGKIKAMPQRRVLDVFDYAISSSVPNKGLLLQTTVLGPHKLAEIIAACSDMGITERALELAFRLGVEVVGAKMKGASSKAKWDDHLFPLKLYADDREEILPDYQAMTLKNCDETLPLLLEKLSKRDPSNFKSIFARTLSSNGTVFENNDAEVSKEVTFGSNISINAESFTAVTTKELSIDGEDESEYVQLLLETNLKNIQDVQIYSKSKNVTCIQLCLYESATLDSIALETVEGDPEIVFEIDDSALDDLKVVLDSRKIISKPASTLPTPRITPKVRSQVSSAIDVSKGIITTRPPLTPPLQIGSAGTSRNNSSQLIPQVIGSITSSSGKDSSISIKGNKRPTSALALTDSASSKRAKVKNVTFNSNLEDDEQEAHNVEKIVLRSPTTEILAPDSDGILDSITNNNLRQFDNGREILAGLEPHSDTSSSSGDDDEILKKHLEGLSGSAIKRLLAKASVIPLEDLMDADEVEVSINSNIEADLIEAVKENIENKKFAGRKDVEEEVEYENQFSLPLANRAPPRLNLIRPTPRPEVTGSVKKSAHRQKFFLSTSQSQNRKNQASQAEGYETEQHRGRSKFNSDDQELANVLGAISSIVLQKLAANSENAAQAFNARTYVLESSARKLAKQFYDDTENIIQATKEALNFDRVRIRNETINSIERSSESTGRILRKIEQIGAIVKD